mmetsp:Transcript_6045/g.11021  ORF Transcript_6045/g.11021 Transcript_6045/m.11021 type:complete len:130 (-) Transcript_6045:1958-2347(-)
MMSMENVESVKTCLVWMVDKGLATGSPPGFYQGGSVLWKLQELPASEVLHSYQAVEIRHPVGAEPRPNARVGCIFLVAQLLVKNPDTSLFLGGYRFPRFYHKYVTINDTPDQIRRILFTFRKKAARKLL